MWAFEQSKDYSFLTHPNPSNPIPYAVLAAYPIRPYCNPITPILYDY